METSGGRRPYPAALLGTTLDQSRALVAVDEAGSTLGAARLLGREQSSVREQLDTLNRDFTAPCGEPLVTGQGRRPMRFTATGRELAELARTTLDAWLDGIQRGARGAAGALTVGSTRYTLG
ncbi:LysR family transcriptional regulator [Streptomyces buecherae]|uniref:LysR family transcriptional regulator n=1 Tax=Streptomyces buecherae TaxID=2763006 RepID=UPI002FCD3733